MIDLLKALNDKNPSFGPILVHHPGNIVRHRMFVPFSEVLKETAEEEAAQMKSTVPE
jgi:hypothetical protein